MAPPVTPSRHPRLTFGQRLEIAREHARGVSPQELAARFGVSRQTIHATVRAYRDAPAVQDAGTRVVGVRVSPRRMQAFEAAIARYGLTKSEALKRLMDAAGTLLAPDQDVAQRLQRLGAEVNRIGLNLNQVSRACNEARQKGQRIPYTAKSHAEVRAAVELVVEVVGQVSQMARGQRGQLDVAVAAALRTEREPGIGKGP